MTIAIRIPVKPLKAVSRFMAVKDPREVLNGVQVEASEHCTLLAATNGHILGAHRCRVNNTLKAPVKFQLPAQIVAQVIKLKVEEIKLVKDGANLTYTVAGTTTTFTPGRLKFPAWRRTVPDEVSGTVGHYNPAYLATLQNAMVDLKIVKSHQAWPTLHQNGEGPALVTFDGYDDFVGVVMSLRRQEEEKKNELPDFAHRIQEPAETLGDK